jgi:hypothetical protein
MICRGIHFGSKTVLKYQRGHITTKRHQRRLRQQQRQREKTMENCPRLTEFFRNAADAESHDAENPTATTAAMPATDRKENQEELEASIADLERTLRSKSLGLTGQNRTRHEAVLRFLYYQRTQKREDTRQLMALQVARCFNRGKWFAEKLVSWEISWRKNRTIPKGKQGCFQKVKSWLTDEGVELAVREYLSGAGESK